MSRVSVHIKYSVHSRGEYTGGQCIYSCTRIHFVTLVNSLCICPRVPRDQFCNKADREITIRLLSVHPQIKSNIKLYNRRSAPTEKQSNKQLFILYQNIKIYNDIYILYPKWVVFQAFARCGK